MYVTVEDKVRQGMLVCMYVCLYVCVFGCMRWLKFPSARLILGSAMKRPAGQPVHSSSELDAWVTTLQAQALVASQAMSALCEREILCEYLGQRQGSARHGRFPIRTIGNFHVARSEKKQGSVFAGVLLARQIWNL